MEIRVDGLTYYQIKLKAHLFEACPNGANLTAAQRIFVGLEPWPHHPTGGWCRLTLPAAEREREQRESAEPPARLRLSPATAARLLGGGLTDG